MIQQIQRQFFRGGGARFSNAYFSEFSGANYTKFGHDKKIMF